MSSIVTSNPDRYIDSVAPILIAVGKEVSEKCGWAISMFMGGPVPLAGGAIQVARYVLRLTFLHHH
jgi:hypothetical protein